MGRHADGSAFPKRLRTVPEDRHGCEFQPIYSASFFYLFAPTLTFMDIDIYVKGR